MTLRLQCSLRTYWLLGWVSAVTLLLVARLEVSGISNVEAIFAQNELFTNGTPRKVKWHCWCGQLGVCACACVCVCVRVCGAHVCARGFNAGLLVHCIVRVCDCSVCAHEQRVIPFFQSQQEAFVGSLLSSHVSWFGSAPSSWETVVSMVMTSRQTSPHGSLDEVLVVEHEALQASSSKSARTAVSP